MKPYKWRNTSTAFRYVCSMTGSDFFGDGTRENPYKTQGRAWNATPTKPGTIICRGYFSEDMADGNHVATIRGDYEGAAVFDGNDQFLIYGFTLIDIIIKNTAVGSNDLTVWTGSGLFAGAGRAHGANNVGNAAYVYGVAGSPVILDRAAVYWGVLGGSTAVSNNVFSKIRRNAEHPISLGWLIEGSTLVGNTFYNVKIADRRKRVTSRTGTLANSIFGDFDFFADDAGVNLSDCLILADCQFFYNGNEITLSGSTPEARYQSLVDAMDALGIPLASRMGFTNCKFSLQTSYQVFNNPERVDFTVHPDSDAVKSAGIFYGAKPPAINIPIMDDSSQVAETWDEQSASGIIKVEEDAICIDELSIENEGKIYSKILRFNPSEININAVFSDFAAKFAGYQVYLWNEDLLGQEYFANEILPTGRYIVRGTIVYDGQNFGDKSILVITDPDTSFIDTNSASKVILLLDENISNVCYVRELAYIFIRITSVDGLERGGVYYNYGNENITYRGRTIVPRESFVADNDEDTFSSSAGYQIGIMFDDTRVPSQQWIPAQLFGEYFVWKDNGTIEVDNDGAPISSGNYLSFQTTANGGYSQQLIKSILSTTYAQFMIIARRYNHA